MHRSWLRTLLLTCLAVCGCTAQSAPPRSVAKVSLALERALESAERVDVLVSLRAPSDAQPDARDGRARAIAQLQRDVLARSAQDLQVSRAFRHVPALAGTVSRSGLETLQRDPDVTQIQLDAPGRGALAQAVPAIGADTVQRVFKVTGRGVRVAILDTGVDAEHPDLRGAVVAQHCFTSGACPPRRSNEGNSAEDDNGHGTAIAGVIASRGVVAPRGFAPEAEIVAVKVQGADNRGVSTNWVAGLDWVYNNLRTLQVDVVVMSFGTEILFNTAECEQMLGALSRAVDNLVRAGVLVIASSGNAGSDVKLPAPACNTGVLAVGASYDSALGAQPPGGATYAQRLGESFAACRDETTSASSMACFSNSGPKLELLAPGAPIVSSALEGKTREMWGTSNASAAVGGVVALLKQCNPELRPSAIKELLLRTATRSIPSAVRPSYPIVDARRAVEEGCPDLAGLAAGAGGVAAQGGAGAGGVAGTPGPMIAAAGVSGAVSSAAQAGVNAGATSSAVTAANVATAGAGGSPLADPEERDAGIGMRSFPLMPYVPPRGSLQQQPPADKGGCNVVSLGHDPRIGAAWALALALCALNCRARARRRHTVAR